MSSGMIERAKQLAKREKGGRRQELSVSLDKDSIDRFKRIRTKLRSVNESQLIALALKLLEQKTDRIIKRQVREQAPALVKEGLGIDEIAEYFNKKGIPAPGDAEKWDKEVISDLLYDKRKRRPMARFKGDGKQQSVITHQ